MNYSLVSGDVELIGPFLSRTLGAAGLDGDDIIYIGGGTPSSFIYRYFTTSNTYTLVNNLPAEKLGALSDRLVK